MCDYHTLICRGKCIVTTIVYTRLANTLFINTHTTTPLVNVVDFLNTVCYKIPDSLLLISQHPKPLQTRTTIIVNLALELHHSIVGGFTRGFPLREPVNSRSAGLVGRRI